LAECFLDARNPIFVEHSVEQLVSQRVYGLALGYEDLNDHEQLRHDPLLRVLAGKADVEDSPLAGKSTLNRLELSDGTPNRYKKITFWKEAIDELLVNVFLESHASAPEEIILDLDVTDFALHGEQEGRFFHGYYDCYCYLPLYIFCGDQILCARLRQSNSDAAAGSLAEVQRIVGQIRAAWPEVRIILRGDSGFCRNELMTWCEQNGVDFVFDSSEEIVGGFRFRQLAKRVIEGEFEASEGAKAVGFSHGDFGLVVQALDDAAGKQFLGTEIVQDQFAVIAQ
jgi:hypothetical protein